MAIMTLLNELDLFHAFNMIMDRVGDLEDYILEGGGGCYVMYKHTGLNSLSTNRPV